MKRLLSLIVVCVLFLSVTGTGIAATVEGISNLGVAKGISFSTFTCDTFGIEIGKQQSVLFKTEVVANRKLSEKDVAVYDENDNFVTHLNDLGKNGDEKANDGIFSGNVALKSNTRREATYHVEILGNSSYTHTIAFHKNVKDIDWNLIDSTWKRIERLEDSLEAMGTPDEEIVALMYDYLVDYDYIESIQFDDDLTISFTFDSGIQNIFARFSDEQKAGVGNKDYSETIEAMKARDDYVGENKLAVYCPYYGYDSNFTFNYQTRANAMNSVLNFDGVDFYYGAQASVESFKNFDQYGIIMIDSHGAATNGGGYICIPAPGAYDQQDVAEGHLVLSGSTVYMRGTFMQKYCDTLPNTMIYVGICYGMAAGNLYSPLISHGAGFIVGYNNSVSFKFDGEIMDKYHEWLAKTDPSTNDLYTGGQAFTNTVNQLGAVDPYSSSQARFVYAGNVFLHARTHKIPVESVAINPSELTLYHNNTYQLELEVLPLEANKYTVAWASDNEEVASVTQNGFVSAGIDGTAKITCTITDFSQGAEIITEAECLVTIDGALAVTGLELSTGNLEIYTQGTYNIDARVLPYNASNQKLLFESSDEEILTVSEDGVILGVSQGAAVVYITTEDGGFTNRIIVSVQIGGLNAAANAPSGTLNFTSNTTYPWVEQAAENRLMAVSSNIGVGNTSSMMTLEAGFLPVGAQLVFEWKVSCEKSWDKLKFFRNGTVTAEITGETDWATYTFTVQTEGEYTFAWSYLKDLWTDGGKDCGYVDNVDIIIPGTVHTVTFLDFAGYEISTQEVAHGAAAQLPEEPFEIGHIFMGWSIPTSAVRSDLVVAPLFLVDPDYVAVYYTVTFVDFDDTVLFVDEQVLETKSATAPADPVRDGHKFVGWDTDFSSVTSDLTVKAQYVMYGDANNDGVLNSGDAVIILLYSLNPVELTENQMIAYDFNFDTLVNTGDATAILIALIS
ncbi:MAG: hypothetical protein GX802_04350 [Clostridiales bacterium]|nr:hypothetical protein [Clostridiales bacterium]